MGVGGEAVIVFSMIDCKDGLILITIFSYYHVAHNCKEFKISISLKSQKMKK